MNDARFAQTADTDLGQEQLMELVEEIGERLRKGEKFSIDDYIVEHPEFADQLRQLLPTLQAMADLGYSMGDDDSSVQQEAAPKVLGDFRIVRELGRGGMGVVYEAEQLSMNRRVALKMLPFAAVADSKALQRFKNEVRAAATLNHTNIVPVYSIGEERGIHYYAMQLIQGQTLAEIVSDLRQLRDDKVELSGASIAEVLHSSHGKSSSSGADSTLDYDTRADETTPKAALSTVATKTDREFFRSVARLGVQAAEALDHAHERGVLHRDIKPGNLMLDAESQLYITDFGLARIEADAGMTMTGDLVGTLRYMSPEQVLAKRIVVDQRSDVYSLGATLFELLTLEPAIDGTDREEVLRKIAFNEPRKPRSINRAIPAELETIILTALAKDPIERYGNAGELAADLQRFLDYQPIHAKPPNLTQRLMKWSFRNGPLVASAAALLVFASVGLTISTFLIGRQRNIAIQERDEAQRQERRADENFRRAKAAVDQYLTKVGQDNRVEVALRKELLELALPYYTEFIKQHSGDPTLLKELADAHVRVSEIAWHSSIQKCIESRLKALQLHRQLVAENPDDPSHLKELANSYYWVGHRYNEAKEHRNAIQMQQKSIQLLTNLAAQVTDNDEHLRALGHCHYHVAMNKSKIGEEAQSSYLTSLEIYRQRLANKPDRNKRFDLAERLVSTPNVEPDWDFVQATIDRELSEPNGRQLFYIARLCKLLSMRKRHFGRFEGAIETARQGVMLFEKFVKENPNAHIWKRSGLDGAYGFLVYLMKESGDHDAAINVFKKRLAFRKSVSHEMRDPTAHRRQTARDYAELAELQHRIGKKAEAIESELTAEQTFRELAASSPEQREGFFNFLGELGSKQRDPAASRGKYEAAIKGLSTLTGPDVGSSLYTQFNRLYDILPVGGEQRDAVTLHLEAIELTEKNAKARPGNLGHQIILTIQQLLLGIHLDETGGAEEMAALQPKKLSGVLRKLVGSKSNENLKEVVQAFKALALSMNRHGRFVDAVDVLTALIEVSPNDATLYERRACNYQFLEQFDKAFSDAKKALKVAQANAENSSEGVGHYRLGQIYLSLAKYDDAVREFQLQLSKQPTDNWARHGIAKVEALRGNYAKAIAAHAHEVERPGALVDGCYFEHLAWLLCNCPEEQHRDYAKGLFLALKAPGGDSLRVFNDRAAGLNTKGAALYRSRRFERAVLTLEKALQIKGLNTDFNDCMQTFHHYLLAMSHHQLGRTEKARTHYALARQTTKASLEKLRRLARQPSHTIHRTAKDLEYLCDEATELLGSDLKEE